MKFTVGDLVHFKMHDRISIGRIKVVTDRLIHLVRLEDREWFMFYDKTYDEVKRNFGNIMVKEFKEKYPELTI